MQIIHALQQWWANQSLLEIVGVITGLLCVVLAALNNIWNWPIAIISVGIYIFIFMQSRLYADMGLQIYFLVKKTCATRLQAVQKLSRYGYDAGW